MQWVSCIIALALLIGLPFLAPNINKIHEGWNLSRTQLLYVVLSSEIAVAVYVWGVGNWSRFEPPSSAAAPSNQANTDPSGQPTDAAPGKGGN